MESPLLSIKVLYEGLLDESRIRFGECRFVQVQTVESEHYRRTIVQKPLIKIDPSFKLLVPLDGSPLTGQIEIP